MADLPLILAGPIVRRVTTRSVSVWVVLSESATVTLSIWSGRIATGPGEAIFVPADASLHSASRQTIGIGQKLHFVVVTIDVPPSPVPPLLPGQIYSYNLDFATSSGSSDLKSLKLLVDKLPSAEDPVINRALGYLPDVLPSFVLPPVTIDKFNLVHGSCRRIHAPGKDTMAVLDSIIKKAINDNDPDQRPHQLFLTGDQIYADEMPSVLMLRINELGKTLLGIKENLIAKKQDGTMGTYEATMTDFPASRRKRIVTKNAKFTTGEGANHLMSFSEFVATYLMCWNNAVWPLELYATFDELKAKGEDLLATWDVDEYPLSKIEQELAPREAGEEFDPKEEIKDKSKKTYVDDLREFITFRVQLPLVRRVLANVPVYMIMDDHEVTDDWYITKNWRDTVLSAPLGVNILRNALMAYTLFQDWGNDPATYAPQPWTADIAFEKGDYVKPTAPNGHIFRAIQAGVSGGTQPAWPVTKGSAVSDGSVIWREAGTDKKEDLLNQLKLVFPSSEPAGPVQAPADAIDVLFGFNLPDETPPPISWHYSVPASETTVYVLDTRTRRTYETRHSSPGLLSKSAMDDQIPLDQQPEHFLIFVSPAPVFGLAMIEDLLQPSQNLSNPYKADPEPWSYAPAVFADFMQRLQKFKRVVFLSGDIHFGISLVLDYWRKDLTEPPARFIQFVSSALKNQKFLNEQFLMGGFIQRVLVTTFYPAEILGYAHRTGVQVTNPAGKPNQSGYRVRLRKEPVLLPTRGWPQGSVVNQPPEWSWRLQLFGDERDELERPQKIRIPEITPDVDPGVGDADAAYHKVLVRQMEVFKKNMARKVQWDNNIGVIKFGKDANGNLTASQQLWYWLPGDDITDEPAAYNVSTRPLEPTDAPRPAIRD